MISARPAFAFAALCALWLAALVSPACAQTVQVRSGAHDGFDRLVLDMPERRSWRVVPGEDGASVIFEGAALRFDLGAVFERIGRQRLRTISVHEGGRRLDLAFACDCMIAPFWHADSMLVVDIADAPADVRVSSPARPRLRPLALPGSLSRDRLDMALPSIAGATLAARLDSRTGPRLTALPETGSGSAGEGLDAMRTALGKQLGHAASQGLVTPVPGRQTRQTVPPPASGDPAPASEAHGAAAGAVPIAAPGLRITTSMDRDMSGLQDRDTPAEMCPPLLHLDVPSWSGARPFAFEVGELYGALFGEFDTVREAEVLRLARLYIHHGFGAEARQVLGWLDTTAPDIALARDLALLVEGEPLSADAALAGALECGEPAVLWAILAAPDLPEERVFDHRALRRSFVALPMGLQSALGPLLVQRLVAAGHHPTADALLRHLRGGDALADAETGLARAALASETGRDAVAETALREVIRTNAGQAGVALAETIERALARGEPVDFEDAQLAGALAFEHRGAPLGGRLAKAYLSALAASGAFDEAISEFSRLRDALTEDEAARVASVLISYLERQADDITFLRAMLSDAVTSPEALDDDVALGVARRLLALGFPDHAARHSAGTMSAAARHMTATGEEGTANAGVRLLRARIALAQDRPADAFTELLGLNGDEAGLLRAEALAARGEHAEARRLFAAHDEARRADRAALHTGRVTEMAGAGESPLRDLGQLLRSDAAAPAVTADADIASHHAFLERSTELRGAMERLLAATPAPAARQ